MRTPRRVLRVLTEGARTEPDYLDLWRRRNPDVFLDIRDTGMSPDALVRRAKEYLRHQPRKKADWDFDAIWCVFDTDQHPNLPQAMEEARHAGIEVAVSNPCFELWLVLHLQDQRAYIHRHDVQRVAKDLGLSDGKRIPETAGTTLVDEFQTAKARARELDQHHDESGSPPRSNPSTDVWRLVDELRDGMPVSR